MSAYCRLGVFPAPGLLGESKKAVARWRAAEETGMWLDGKPSRHE
jgi:hypothetical protein